MRQRLSILLTLAFILTVTTDVQGQRKPPRDPGGPNPNPPGAAPSVPRNPNPAVPRNPNAPFDPNRIPRDARSPSQQFDRDSINFQNMLDYFTFKPVPGVEVPPLTSREEVIRQMLELLDEKLKSQVTQTLQDSVQVDADALKEPAGPKPKNAAAIGAARLALIKGGKSETASSDAPQTSIGKQQLGDDLDDLPVPQLVQIHRLLSDAADASAGRGVYSGITRDADDRPTEEVAFNYNKIAANYIPATDGRNWNRGSSPNAFQFGNGSNPAAAIYDYPGEYAARFDGVDPASVGDPFSFTSAPWSSGFHGRTETVGHNETITIHGNRTEHGQLFPTHLATQSSDELLMSLPVNRRGGIHSETGWGPDVLAGHSGRAGVSITPSFHREWIGGRLSQVSAENQKRPPANLFSWGKSLPGSNSDRARIIEHAQFDMDSTVENNQSNSSRPRLPFSFPGSQTDVAKDETITILGGRTEMTRSGKVRGVGLLPNQPRQNAAVDTVHTLDINWGDGSPLERLQTGSLMTGRNFFPNITPTDDGIADSIWLDLGFPAMPSARPAAGGDYWTFPARTVDTVQSVRGINLNVVAGSRGRPASGLGPWEVSLKHVLNGDTSLPGSTWEEHKFGGSAEAEPSLPTRSNVFAVWLTTGFQNPQKFQIVSAGTDKRLSPQFQPGTRANSIPPHTPEWSNPRPSSAQIVPSQSKTIILANGVGLRPWFSDRNSADTGNGTAIESLEVAHEGFQPAAGNRFDGKYLITGATHQYNKVTVRGWNPLKKEEIVGEAGSPHRKGHSLYFRETMLQEIREPAGDLGNIKVQFHWDRNPDTAATGSGLLGWATFPNWPAATDGSAGFRTADRSGAASGLWISKLSYNTLDAGGGGSSHAGGAYVNVHTNDGLGMAQQRPSATASPSFDFYSFTIATQSSAASAVRTQQLNNKYPIHMNHEIPEHVSLASIGGTSHTLHRRSGEILAADFNYKARSSLDKRSFPAVPLTLASLTPQADTAAIRQEQLNNKYPEQMNDDRGLIRIHAQYDMDSTVEHDESHQNDRRFWKSRSGHLMSQKLFVGGLSWSTPEPSFVPGGSVVSAGMSGRGQQPSHTDWGHLTLTGHLTQDRSAGRSIDEVGRYRVVIPFDQHNNVLQHNESDLSFLKRLAAHNGYPSSSSTRTFFDALITETTLPAMNLPAHELPHIVQQRGGPRSTADEGSSSWIRVSQLHTGGSLGAQYPKTVIGGFKSLSGMDNDTESPFKSVSGLKYESEAVDVHGGSPAPFRTVDGIRVPEAVDTNEPQAAQVPGVPTPYPNVGSAPAAADGDPERPVIIGSVPNPESAQYKFSRAWPSKWIGFTGAEFPAEGPAVFKGEISALEPGYRHGTVNPGIAHEFSTATYRVGGSSSPYSQGDTLTHEVGHWLGLQSGANSISGMRSNGAAPASNSKASMWLRTAQPHAGGGSGQPFVSGSLYNGKSPLNSNITLQRGYTADDNIWSWEKAQESPFNALTNQFGGKNANGYSPAFRGGVSIGAGDIN